MLSEAKRNYLEGRIESARPLELICVLYEVAVGAVRQARAHLASGDRMSRSREISRGLDALAELMHAVDRGGGYQLSGKLLALYSYMRQRLLKAHTTESDRMLQEVEGLLVTLLDGWRTVSTAEAQSAATQHESAPASGFSRAYAMPYGGMAAPVASRGWSF